LLPLCIIVLVF